MSKYPRYGGGRSVGLSLRVSPTEYLRIKRRASKAHLTVTQLLVGPHEDPKPTTPYVFHQKRRTSDKPRTL